MPSTTLSEYLVKLGFSVNKDQMDKMLGAAHNAENTPPLGEIRGNE
jgi:hypothetical protein